MNTDKSLLVVINLPLDSRVVYFNENTLFETDFQLDLMETH